MGKVGGKGSFLQEMAALAALLLTLLWFNEEILVAGKVPFFRDLGPYFYPMRFHLAQSFQSGELPLWSRHIAMGFPFLANLQAGAFYPPHLAFLFLPFFDAVRLLFVFHYLVAAVGSYLLLRYWSYPISLSVIGAMLFSFGGALVSLSNLLDHFQAAVWLPWLLLFGERSLKSNAWRDFCLWGLLLLVQFLAGSPEIYAMSLVLSFLDGVKLRSEDSAVSYRRLLLQLFGVNVLVAGLAMVQILPTLELFQQSWRAATIPYANVTAWSLHPARLVNLFLLDKEVNLYVFSGFHFYFGRERPLLMTLYLGAAVLPGICLWLLTAPWREKALLGGLVLASLALAVGDHTPLYPLLFRLLPFLGLVRFPEKFFFLASGLLLFIAASGFFRFTADARLVTRRGLLIISLIALGMFLLPYLFFRLQVGALIGLIAGLRQSPTTDHSTLMIASGVLVQLERQLSLLVGIFLMLYLRKSGRLRESLFGLLMAAVVFFDLASAHRPYQFALEPQTVERSPKLIDGPEREPYRLFYNHNLSHLHPNYYRFSPRPYAETVSSVFATLIPNTGVFHGFDYMQELEALGRKPYDLFLKFTNGLPPERLYRLLALLNVKYVNSLQPLPPGEITLVRHFAEYPAWLYRIERAVPRVYVASRIVVEQDPRKVLERLSSEEFQPLEQVVLEQPIPLPPAQSFQAETTWIRYNNRLAGIQASLNSAGILVLADAFYPGWEVYIDGEKREILRANYFFRAVLVPAGSHRVEFRYEPYWFKVGLALSSVIGVSLMFFVLLNFLKKFRPHVSVRR